MNFFQFNEVIENFIGFQIYCDLDGVLVDLEEGLVQKMHLHDKPTRIEILKDLSQLKKQGHDLSDLFAELPWMKDGKDLWTYLLPYEPFILTAANVETQKEICEGKKKWCSEHLQLPDDKLICEHKKEKYAGYRKILIDDWSRNIKEWEKAGGIGILHRSASETIGKLKDLIVSDDSKNPLAVI